MPNNKGMIGLARKLGFTVDIQLEDGIVSLSLQLVPEQSQTADRNC
jgi:acetyltransferase